MRAIRCKCGTVPMVEKYSHANEVWCMKCGSHLNLRAQCKDVVARWNKGERTIKEEKEKQKHV